MRTILRVLGCFVLIATTLLNPVLAASPDATYGKQGMVASRTTLASKAGIEVMKQGGNAVDGAVATAFALAVTYPSAGNIGGGGFAVVRTQDGKVITLDHREKAPHKAHRDMYLDAEGEVIKGLSTNTLQAAGVPGSVDGLLELLESYGSLPLKKVMAPAIRLAEKGFPLNRELAEQFASVLPRMSGYPASMAKFSKNGQPYQEGDVWIQKDLAKTLRLIAKNGREGFYAGETARLIVEEMQRGGGLIDHQDLADYHSVYREPVHGTYRGYDIWGMPPPSSGGVLVTQILNMLEPFDVAGMGYGSASLIHLMVEAERRAYADRAEHLGDPDYYDVPMKKLIDKAYALQRFADFDPEKASKSSDIGAGTWPEESPQTTHFSVMDKDGMMVSLTTTLNSSYGNKIVVPGTGILLNNEMNDFSVKPDYMNQFNLIGREANAIAPGKRMLSSMSPTIVTKDGKGILITGSPGGATIITTTLQVILNVVDHQMNIADAVSLPRFHHQWLPDLIMHEAYAFSPDTSAALKKLGHNNFRPLENFTLGDANSILVTDGEMAGIKDPRGYGVAVGF